MPMDRATLVDLKARLRNAQSLLLDAAAAYEKGGAIQDAQRCRHRSRDILDEIEMVNDRLSKAAIPMPAAARAT